MGNVIFEYLAQKRLCLNAETRGEVIQLENCHDISLKQRLIGEP